jgi:small conductance mechanosensitive channel
MNSVVADLAQQSEPSGGDGQTVTVQDLVPGTYDVFLKDWAPESVSGQDVLIALAVVTLGMILAFLIGRILKWSLLRWSEIPPFGAELAGRLTTYLIILLAVISALEIIGLTLGPLVIVIVAVVMMAWAMRPLLQNLGAGLMLQARGPFQPGDEIQSADYEGSVEEVNARVVIINTPDGRTVYLPNQEVVNTPLVNLTAEESRRSTFEVGVAYDTDLDEAVDVIKTALRATEGVLPEPHPEAFVHGFDDSNISISVWFWHTPEIYTSWKVTDEAARSTVRALRSAGIVISFPRRTLAWAE